MIRSFSALASVLVLASAGTAFAAPHEGAARVGAPVHLESSRQLVVHRPDLVSAEGGLQVQGMACVANLRPSSGGASVLVQHIGAGGQVIETTRAGLSGLRDRNARCGVYSAHTAWQLAPSDSVKVCAAHAGACVGGAD